MQDSEIKDNMIVKLKTVSEFASALNAHIFVGQLSKIKSIRDCGECQRKHLILEELDYGRRVIAEIDSKDLLKANT
jgi:hypothetical protein